MKKIKELTFEKACKIEGLDPKKVIPDFSCYPERHRKSMAAHAKCVIMVECANKIANDGQVWIPDYDNSNQAKYEPRFYKPRGSSGFRFGDCVSWRSASGVGSRLCFISYEVMMAMVDNKNYMEIYNEYAL